MIDLRNILHFVNMRKLADLTGVNYDSIKNYKKGTKKYLNDEDFNKVVQGLRDIFELGGIR